MYLVFRTTLVALLLWGAVPAWAQRKVEMPKPETLTLYTRDRVAIKATYYAGGVVKGETSNKQTDGKKVLPFILVHDLDGKRGDLEGFAQYLQNLGHAVIVPDLRGHGESAGSDIDTKRLTKPVFVKMVNDLVACKKHLMDANNRGELNIDMLTVAGCGLGATVAAYYTVFDHKLPQLPTHRQGLDVKALVMVSPQRSVKGYTINEALRQLAVLPSTSTMPVMIIVGRRDRSRGDVSKMHNVLENGRPDLPDDPQLRSDQQSLFLFEPDTSLESTRLLYARVDPVGMSPVRLITDFIKLKIEPYQDRFPWQERRSPLDDGD